MDKNGRVEAPCPGCKRRLAFVIRRPQETETSLGTTSNTQAFQTKKLQDHTPLAYLQVVENVFGYAAQHPLYEGLNRIGRYNDKHTHIEVAIRTADPSLDRNQSLLMLEYDSEGNLQAYIMDDDSMTGTFVNAREIDPQEKCPLHDGDVITLGATSLIFSMK